MKKPITFIISTVIIMLLLSCLIYKYVKNTKSEKNSFYSSSLNTQSIEEKSENNSEVHSIPNAEIKSLYHVDYDKKDKSKQIVVKVDYIVIENKNNLESINKLNDDFKKEAEESFSKILKEIANTMNEYSEYKGDPIENIYEYIDTSKVTKNNKNGILSVSSSCYNHMGPIRPWTFVKSYVIDYINGKKLNIFDVIKGNKYDIINMIKKETIKSVLKILNESKQSRTEEEVKKDLYFDDLDWNCLSFYLDNDSLVVEFSQGEIYFALYGVISVNIPYNNIEKYELSIDYKFTE